MTANLKKRKQMVKFNPVSISSVRRLVFCKSRAWVEFWAVNSFPIEVISYSLKAFALAFAKVLAEWGPQNWIQLIEKKSALSTCGARFAVPSTPSLTNYLPLFSASQHYVDISCFRTNTAAFDPAVSPVSETYSKGLFLLLASSTHKTISPSTLQQCTQAHA